MTVITKSLMDSIMEFRMLQYLEKSVYHGQELMQWKLDNLLRVITIISPNLGGTKRNQISVEILIIAFICLKADHGAGYHR